MVRKILIKWWQSHFGGPEMLQLFLKIRDGVVTAEEKRRIEKWVSRDSLRIKAYNYFDALLLFKKRVTDAVGQDVRVVLRDIAEKFPKPFGGINAQATEYTIRTTLLKTIDQAMLQVAGLIVYGFKWLTVVILLLRAIILGLGIIILREIARG